MDFVSFFALFRFFWRKLITYGSLYYFILLAEAHTFTCPQHGQSPVVTPQGYNKFCSKEGQRAECPEGAICLLSKNDLYHRICCYSDTSIIQHPPICPNNADRRTTKSGIYQCSSDRDCHFGYFCVQAINKMIQICCESAVTFCPSGFAPFLNPDGNKMPCLKQINCPNGALCLPSKHSDSKLCCKSNESSHVCPDNMFPLLKNGMLEGCSAIGPCSEPGYSCKFFSNHYVCCGHEKAKILCADGREIFQQTTDNTYYCNPFEFPSSCPNGYECAQSTESASHVCCKDLNDITTSTTPNVQCPSGWNPYRNEVNGQLELCSGPFDTSCPTGYSCTPSSFIGRFVCCRLASVLQCTRGQTFLANSQPRLCSRSRSNQCPRGYSCEQSTSPTVTICCSNYLNEGKIICSDGSTPALIHNNVQICPILGSVEGCPAAHICQVSNRGIGVCCRSFKARLPPISNFNTSYNNSSVVFKKDGKLMECIYDTSLCPSTDRCLYSPDDHHMYCCQRSISLNGVDVESHVKTCKSHSDCKKGFICQLANYTSGLYICCSMTPLSKRQYKTHIKGQKLEVYEQDNTCDRGFICGTIANSDKSVCCNESRYKINIWPDNRLPIFSADTNSLVYCDETAYTCPSGEDCIQMRNSNRFVCYSSIPRCLTGQPQLDFSTKSTVRCFSNNSTSCSSSMSCQQSSILGVKLCCSNVSSSNIEPSATP